MSTAANARQKHKLYAWQVITSMLLIISDKVLRNIQEL